MNIRQYLRIKTAAFNWMSNADSPENTLSDDSDLVKNLDKAEDNSFDPVMNGPIYQDVNPIYQEPKKYGIPEEVAMVERERHNDMVNNWKQEYDKAIMPSILESMGAYSHTPSVSELTSDLLGLHYGTRKPEPVVPLSKDKYIAGYQRMQRAPRELRSQYERTMNARNELLMRRSIETDPAVQAKLTKAIQRIENNMKLLIEQLDK